MNNTREEFIHALMTIHSDERGEIRMTDESRYELIDLLRRPVEWINMKQKLPERSGKYLVYNEQYRFMVVASYSVRHKAWNCYDNFTPDDVRQCATDIYTHWMPLPKPPKGKIR